MDLKTRTGLRSAGNWVKAWLFAWVCVCSAFARTGTEGVPLFFAPTDRANGAAFVSRTPGFTVGLEAETATFWLRRQSPSPLKSWSQEARLRLRMLGATGQPAGVAEGELPTRLNFFQGRDPSGWRTGVKTYERIRYRDVYPGIDVVYYGNDRQLEYDFIVAPAADPRSIRLTFEGARAVSLTEEGDLVLRTSSGEVRQRRPMAYQRDGLRREPVEVHYEVSDHDTPVVRFSLGAYDPTRPLVIDPVVIYAGYLGGSAFDLCRRLLIQESGRLVVVGETASLNLPVENPLLVTNVVTVTNIPPEGGEGVVTNIVVTNYYGGISQGGPGKEVGNPLGTEAMVAAFSPDGQVLEYCTYLGGNAIDAGIDVAVDVDGGLLLYGLTQSADFPLITNAWVRIAYTNVCVTNGFIEWPGLGEIPLLECTRVYTNTWPIPEGWDVVWKTNISGDDYWGYYDTDAFLTKLSTDGDEIVFSLYQGEDGNDQGMRVAVGPEGRIYLASLTESSVGPLVVCMDQGGVAYHLRGSSFLPYPLALVPTEDRRLWIGGSLTWSGDLALSDLFADWTTNTDGTTNLVWRIHPPFQDEPGGGQDGFLTLLDEEGDISYLSFLGGNKDDIIFGLGLNDDGGVTVAGDTVSTTNFPVVSPLVATNRGKEDLFITRLDGTLTNAVFSTYLGGAAKDHVERLRQSPTGDLLLVGSTLSKDFPGAVPQVTTTGKKTEGLLVGVAADGSRLQFAALLGGPGQDELHDVAVDSEGLLWVAGGTQGGWETNYGSVVTTNWWNVVKSPGTKPPSITSRAMAGVLARVYPGEAEIQLESDAEGSLVLRWPTVLPDYVLQSAVDLAMPLAADAVEVSHRWLNVEGVVRVGTNWVYSVTNRDAREFFQLQRQVAPAD